MIGHSFKTASTVSGDPAKLQPVYWGKQGQDLQANPTHEFTGGAHGSLVARDTGDIVDGLAYVASAAGFLASTGIGQMPAFRSLVAGDLPDLSSVYVPTSRTVNGHALTADVTVSKSDVGLGNVENTALSTWSGSTALTTLGTIVTGVWQGTAIAADKGGTGLTGYTIGDLLYASASNALSKLADVAAGSVLVSGGVGAAPAWSATPTLTSLTLGSTTISAAEIAVIDGVTAGAVTASKALVVDANRDLATIRNLTLDGNLVMGSTTLSETDLAKIDAITNGTAAANKALVADANIDIANVRRASFTGSIGVNGAAPTSDNVAIKSSGSQFGISLFGSAIALAVAGLRQSPNSGGHIFMRDATGGTNTVEMFGDASLGATIQKLSCLATNDDPTENFQQGRAATTDATVTTLYTLTIPASTTYLIDAVIHARRTGGSSGTAEDGAAYGRVAAIKNVGGTATIIGAVATPFTIEDQAAWDCTIDVTGATARIRVTGAANNNITWHASVRCYPVGS